MIRAATPADAPAIALVERLAASHPWSEASVLGTLTADTGFGVVWADGHEVVGHLLASAVLDEGELLTVAVHPDHRRRGVARALHAAAVLRWRERGVTVVHLEVRVDNTGAIALYEAEGWQRQGVRRGYYHDGCDAALYSLRAGG